MTDFYAIVARTVPKSHFEGADVDGVATVADADGFYTVELRRRAHLLEYSDLSDLLDSGELYLVGVYQAVATDGTLGLVRVRTGDGQARDTGALSTGTVWPVRISVPATGRIRVYSTVAASKDEPVRLVFGWSPWGGRCTP